MEHSKRPHPVSRPTRALAHHPGIPWQFRPPTVLYHLGKPAFGVREFCSRLSDLQSLCDTQ